MREPTHGIEFKSRGHTCFDGFRQHAAGFIVAVLGRLAVKALFLQQPAGRVIPEAIDATILVFQRGQAAKSIPPIVQAMSKGIDALRDQSCRGVAIGRGARKRVGVRKQPAFGVVTQLLLSTVWVGDGFKLAGMIAAVTALAVRLRQRFSIDWRIAIAGDVAGSIDALDQALAAIVFPLAAVP